MKTLPFVLLLVSSVAFGQMTIEQARELAQKNHALSYSYHQKFEGHKGYGAPIIITNDGGVAFFTSGVAGSDVEITKLDETGNVLWQAPVKRKHNEMEVQSVVEGTDGDIYAFILSYNYDVYRGGSERVVHVDKNGKILWDIILGDYGLVNSPHCSWIHLNKDGKLELRGHIVPKAKEEGKDPVYHYWTGWLNDKGELEQKVGDVINWSDPAAKKFTEVE